MAAISRDGGKDKRSRLKIEIFLSYILETITNLYAMVHASENPVDEFA